ncbi:MAG TPA: hypothetical protein VL595_20975 [Pseudonocardia sp.]|nr:hypothetical protein [Pseudonocardia sp.]
MIAVPAYPPPPTAPIDLTVPAANSTIVLAALSAVAVVGLGWAVLDGVRSRDVKFLAIWLGGLATSLLEPFADLLGLVWFPVNDQVHAFTMLGIPIPLFVVIGYTNLFGLMPWIMQRGMGSTRRRYWSVSAAMLLGACVFEWLLLRAGTYVYYGNQPLDVWGYPMIWMTINTGACLVAAVVVFRFPGFFTGARALAAVALVPCADGAVMLGTGWPAFAAIHSDLPPVAVHALGLVTIGLGMVLYVVGAEICCTDGRLRPGRREAPATRSVEEARV